jgi:hypothetical protein
MSTQYSRRADPFYPDFAEHVTMYPDSYQKQDLLVQVRRLHGCKQVDLKHISTWFTRYRASTRKKSMQDDDSIRACSPEHAHICTFIYAMMLPNSVYEFHFGATRYSKAVAAKQSVPKERND